MLILQEDSITGKWLAFCLLVICAVNPISRGAAQSIINKHKDYAAAGLTLLNTQECLEYRELLLEYNAGLNCENNNPADLADEIVIFM